MAKIALIGFGEMGRNVLKILHQKEANVTAVFGRKSNLGRDAGDVAGIGNIGRWLLHW